MMLCSLPDGVFEIFRSIDEHIPQSTDTVPLVMTFSSGCVPLGCHLLSPNMGGEYYSIYRCEQLVTTLLLCCDQERGYANACRPMWRGEHKQQCSLSQCSVLMNAPIAILRTGARACSRENAAGSSSTHPPPHKLMGGANAGKYEGKYETINHAVSHSFLDKLVTPTSCRL